MLPPEVVEATIAACRDFADTGLSLMESPHRGAAFMEVLAEAQALVKELLRVPEGYSVLFLGGGARMEFCRVPYNFLRSRAAYLNTGVWAAGAMKEAQMFGEVVEVASSKSGNYSFIPRNYTVPADADYLHITTNNTIYGTQLREDPVSPIPLIADMSSDIFSRPIDVSRYDLIYAGAQKNVSMAGVNLLIIREASLGEAPRPIPTILDYRTHVQHGSMYNTPPVVPIYCALQMLRWIKAQGGVAEMQRRAEKRAAILYAEIDRSKFFEGTAQPESRSQMNITFTMAPGYEHLESSFLSYAERQGLLNLRGHRSVGGFRASCYNAMPLVGAEALASAIASWDGE